jgi:hypothetical protein
LAQPKNHSCKPVFDDFSLFQVVVPQHSLSVTVFPFIRICRKAFFKLCNYLSVDFSKGCRTTVAVRMVPSRGSRSGMVIEDQLSQNSHTRFWVWLTQLLLESLADMECSVPPPPFALGALVQESLHATVLPSHCRGVSRPMPAMRLHRSKCRNHVAWNIFIDIMSSIVKHSVIKYLLSNRNYLLKIYSMSGIHYLGRNPI